MRPLNKAPTPEPDEDPDQDPDEHFLQPGTASGPAPDWRPDSRKQDFFVRFLLVDWTPDRLAQCGHRADSSCPR
eukprot:6042507-Pyramimonas_sp.AAC.1